MSDVYTPDINKQATFFSEEPDTTIDTYYAPPEEVPEAEQQATFFSEEPVVSIEVNNPYVPASHIPHCYFTEEEEPEFHPIVKRSYHDGEDFMFAAWNIFDGHEWRSPYGTLAPAFGFTVEQQATFFSEEPDTTIDTYYAPPEEVPEAEQQATFFSEEPVINIEVE